MKRGLQFKLDGTLYLVDLDKMTSGEARILKHEYGMENVLDYELLDPDILAGLMLIAIRRTAPDLTDDEIRAKVDEVDIVPLLEQLSKQLQKAAAEAEAEAAKDPQSAAGNGSGPAAAKAGGRATTRKTSGARK